MNKEKKIQEYERKQLIDELSKMPPMVIATAYLHAINYTMYGVDVTEKWLTAIQNASALEQAYRKGYYDALQRQEETRDATEERKSVKDYVGSISNPTGFNFYEAQPCEDAVSRAEVYDIITRMFTSIEMTNEQWAGVMQLVKDLPAVQPEPIECEERENGNCPFYAS